MDLQDSPIKASEQIYEETASCSPKMFMSGVSRSNSKTRTKRSPGWPTRRDRHRWKSHDSGSPSIPEVPRGDEYREDELWGRPKNPPLPKGGSSELGTRRPIQYSKGHHGANDVASSCPLFQTASAIHSGGWKALEEAARRTKPLGLIYTRYIPRCGTLLREKEQDNSVRRHLGEPLTPTRMENARKNFEDLPILVINR